MGFYFRKSVRIGPVRLNLSKSGVGISTGIKGFRYGVRPGGRSYLHAGRHGFYVREELTQPPRRTNSQVTSEPTLNYVSVVASDLAKTSPSELDDLLSESYAWTRWDFAVGITATIISAIALLIGPLLSAVAFGVGVAATAYVGWWEMRRRTVYIDFQLEGTARHAFERIVSSANCLASCACIWTLRDSTALTTRHDRKSHAGASELVNRRPAQIGEGVPPWVETDVSLPTINATNVTVYFLPNGLFVYDHTGIAHVDYKQLTIATRLIQFIEDHPPSDARVVGQTWQFPNKDGGPDRRYANNRQIPVCRFGEVELRSNLGFLLLLQTSKDSAANDFETNFKQAVVAIRSTEGDSPYGCDPIVSVNPERYVSPFVVFWYRVRGFSPLLLVLVRRCDALLKKAAGDGNRLIHAYFRVLALIVALLVVGPAFYWIFRLIIDR